MRDPPFPADAPCGSCPYRKDVPSGVWHESEYAKLPLYDGPTWQQPMSAFYCHRQDGRLCAGWVGTHDMDENLGVRMIAASEKIDAEGMEALREYKSAVPLFSTGKEAAEHGLKDLERPSAKAVRVIQKLETRLESSGRNKTEKKRT